MRRFYYIRANPKDVKQSEYDNFARTHLLTDGYLWLMDWVGDVEGMVIKEITADEFNELNNKKSYG